MPELPEAETIVRGLRSPVVGQVMTRARVVRGDILREPRSSFARKVVGARVASIERRGKNVILELDSARVVAVNLGMTGRLLPFPAPPRGRDRPGHPAVLFHFEGGGVLIFDDTRRFGTVECLTDAEWGERSARMGPEPLSESYRSRDLADAVTGSRSPIRSWLLDQRRIAGVGNIYANEALFLAGVHPQRRACDVGRPEAMRLHCAIRRVLREAIRAGGTTIRDYRDATGAEGQYARRLHVYGRDGAPCGRCGATIRRVVFGNRSAFYCPGCQAEPSK